VHLDDSFEFLGEQIAENLERMPCKVTKFHLHGYCPTEFDDLLLFTSNPDGGNVLLVFLVYTESDWIPDTWRIKKRRSRIERLVKLLKIQPDLRRVILSPCPQNLDPGRIPEWMVNSIERMEMFNNELEECLAIHVTNFRILYPDSLQLNYQMPVTWNYVWQMAPNHVYEKLAEMILDLATNPEAAFENQLESIHSDEVRTSTVQYTQKNFATEESLFVPCTEDIYKFVSPSILFVFADTPRPRN
jgi:hypothetical protein